MSTPLATVFHGDVTLEQGSDVTQYGWGDLTANRRCVILGTENSSSNTTGALVVYGGVGITKTLNVSEDTNVLYGITRLTETHIDTTNGPFTVTGGNTANITVSASSQFVSTGGEVYVDALVSRLRLQGGLNDCDAISITATNVDGGITLLSGQTGCIRIVSGSDGITQMTSSGSVSITANGGSGSFVVNSSTGNQNLSIALNGATDSGISIASSGTNVTNKALVITTTNTAGNIEISNAGGLGSGSLTQLVGSGGFVLQTNTGGSVSVMSQGAGSSYTVNSNGPDQNLTVALNGATDSGISIVSSGTNATRDAIGITTTNTGGNIVVSQTTGSFGKVEIITGSSGFIATTQTGGSIVMTTYAATSTYTNATDTAGQDLTVSITGDTDSSVHVTSTGTGTDAVRITTTTNSGGIYIMGQGTVQIDSSDTTNGVQIATNTANTPVYIGTPNSTTTIYGNLDVKGVTTTVESTVVTINDNMMIVNNAPSGTSDGGLAIKRYQAANDGGFGDVVADVPDGTGTVQAGGNTVTTVHLDASASNVDNYYAGWWIRITGGTGQDQVRRIRSYSGSTRTATLYSTADQTGVLNNPVPVEGMDFATIPDVTSTYALYPCEFVMMIWDESHNEFAFVCSGLDPSATTQFAHYSDLHINDLVANGITVNTINGSSADVTLTVTLNNNSTTPVTITGFPYTYGVYTVYVKPIGDDSRTHAIFTIGRVDSVSVPGTVVRLLSAKGVYNDQLDMQWPTNSLPQLLYRPYPNGIGGTTTFKLKIVSL